MCSMVVNFFDHTICLVLNQPLHQSAQWVYVVWLCRFYVGCDRCQDWFHCECVGITQKQADDMDSYICPNCLRRDQEDPINQKELTDPDYELLFKLLHQLQVGEWHSTNYTSTQFHISEYYVCKFSGICLKFRVFLCDKFHHVLLLDYIGKFFKITVLRFFKIFNLHPCNMF